MKKNDTFRRVLATSLSAALAVIYVPFPVMADSEPVTSSLNTDLAENVLDVVSESENTEKSEIIENTDIANESETKEDEVSDVVTEEPELPEEVEETEEPPCKFILNQSENADIYISEIDENGNSDDNRDVFTDYGTEAGKNFKITVKEKNESMRFNYLTINDEVVKTYYNENEEYVCTYALGDNAEGTFEVKADFVPSRYERELTYNIKEKETSGSGKDDGSIIVVENNTIIKPADGYYIDKIFIDNEEFIPPLMNLLLGKIPDVNLSGCTVSDYHNGEKYIGAFKLSDLKKNKTELKIKVEFAKIKKVSLKDVEITSDGWKGKDNTYWIKKPDMLSRRVLLNIKAKNSAYKVSTKSDEKDISKLTDKLEFSTIKRISSIVLYYNDSKYYTQPYAHIIDLSQYPINMFAVQKGDLLLVPDSLPEGYTVYGKDEVKVSLNLSKDSRFAEYGCEELANKLNIVKLSYWFDKNTSDTVEVNGENIDSIIVKSSEHNNKNTVLNVKAVDSLGYEYENSINLNINNIPPEVDVEIDGIQAENAQPNVYNTSRTATVNITDKDYTFNANKDFIINSVIITKDGYNLSYEEKKNIISDMNISNDHAVFNINFTDNGTYQWDVKYKNLAGNYNLSYSDEESGKHNFTIFKIDDATLNKFKIGINGNDGESFNWGGIANNSALNFLSCFKEKVTLIVKVPDNVKVKEIAYYKDYSDKLLTSGELEGKEFVLSDNGVEVSPNEKTIVYARVIDNAGTVIYLGTNGIIADGREPQEISIAFAKEQNIPENRVFNGNVKLSIFVNEDAEEDIPSGLKDVYYQVYQGDTPIDENVVHLLESNDVGKTEYSGDIEIKNNGDNMHIEVTAVDNAGNEKTISFGNFSINTYLMGTYIKNSNKIIDTNDVHTKHFNSNVLQLCIDCPENMFDENTATESVKAAFGENVEYTISNWELTCEDNKDIHTVEITFTNDGEYSMNEFKYTNEANNSVAINGFTFNIDTVKPEGSMQILGKLNNEDGTVTESLEYSSSESGLKADNIEFNKYVVKDSEVSINIIPEEDDVQIDYYIAKNNETFLNEDSLNELYKNYNENGWRKFENEVTDLNLDEGKYVVYLRFTDLAGNYNYICSDGFVVDKTFPTISLKANENPVCIIGDKDVYNKDINLEVNINDENISSGIKSAKYYIIYDNEFKQYCTNNGKETNNESIRAFIQEQPQSCDELTPVDNVITISAEKFNRSDLKVYAVVEDNSGNINEFVKNFDIDITAPEIRIVYKDEINEPGREYFNHDREATIYIQERANHFDCDKFEINGKKLEWTQHDGTTIDKLISNDSNTTVNPDDCVHTANITFTVEGDYNFNLSYTDKAGNKSEEVKSHFTIDKTVPTGDVQIFGIPLHFGSFLSNINFGFWSNYGFDMMATCNDDLSPIEKFEYYKSPKSEALTRNELDSITTWNPIEVKSHDNNAKNLKSNWFNVILANEQAVIYVKITDRAGNVSYINTNGLIADDAFPSGEIIAPEIDVTPQQSASGIYNGDVNVNINVREPGNVYSGINTITYRVLNNGVETQSETLYYFYNEAPQHPELTRSWDGQIVVDGELNNSNNVTIEVTAIDNAGNSNTLFTDISIDTTAPVIDMTLSDNKSNISAEDYYSSRTANFVITERNFDSKDVVLNVTKDNVTTPVSLNWQNVGGSGDSTQYSASLPFTDDGTYSFSISFTDMAGNNSNEVSCKPFIIDSSAPKISVNFDNNEVSQSKYFKEKRTAEIVISDNNVNIDTVDIKITGSLDGKSIELPANPTWVNDGDTYIGKIVFANDGDYTFKISVTDLSGNKSSDVDYGDSVSPESFTIDNENPVINLTVNDSVNNGAYSGEVLPVISYSDLNYDESKVSVSMSGINVEVTDTKMKDDTLIFTLKDNLGETLEWKGKITEQYNENKHFIGKTITMENFPEGKEYKNFDDVYTLTASITDKAGRINMDSIVFSVNRFGSTYDISAVEDIIGKYIKTPKDIEIVEINADRLSNIKVTVFKNSEAIVLNNGTDYKVVADGGNGNWYKYKYIIYKDNFKDDAAYRINIHSKDSADNIAENTLDTKNSEVSFAVDSTAPLIVVANLEDGKTYAEENKSVMFNVNDNLKVDSVEVYLDGENKPYKVWNNIEVEKFITNNEEFTFDIGSGSNGSHTVKIICTDEAGNTAETVISDFYVTTNMMVRYVNNKSVFFGSIAGAVVVLGGSVFWIFRKKKHF